MNWSYNTNYYNEFGSQSNWFSIIFLFLILDLILKGLALWKSAKKNQNVWFIALLVVSSMGILPLIYLLLNRDKVAPAQKKSKKK